MSESQERFQVVVNDEEQYSVWPSGRPVPDGWRGAGFEGDHDACLRHVDLVWTDMRPRSVRAHTRNGG
ncbi:MULTISPECIES: MbtH family NRPS accessory protein [unclassified Streptomyces]|uniref:MbtH family protein n=1 Tax=unclassified Streptomyces TaxID=2593676 RepID=UPI00332E773A